MTAMQTVGTAAVAQAEKSNRWTRFWFTPADPTSLGLIRILAGLITLCVHVAYSNDLQNFFGADAWLNQQMVNEIRREGPVMAPPVGWREQSLPPVTEGPEQESRLAYVHKWGIHPDLAHAKGSYACSLWFHVSDPATMRLVHGFTLAVMILFTIGFCTRITSVLTWLAALTYIQRSPCTLFGMDTMMNLLLIYLMIGPSGAALSLDRFLLKRGYRWFGLLGWGDWNALPSPQPMISANLALRLMQVHYSIIYAAAGSAKLMGGAWWNGTAIWWTVVNYEFTALRYPLYAQIVTWICSHRWLWEIIFSGGVAFTLLLQLSFPFLVWLPRWRWLMICGAVLLHTMIGLLMGLVGFGLLMVALAVSFVPSETVRRLIEGEQDQSPPLAQQPSDLQTCARAA